MQALVHPFALGGLELVEGVGHRSRDGGAAAGLLPDHARLGRGGTGGGAEQGNCCENSHRHSSGTLSSDLSHRRRYRRRAEAPLLATPLPRYGPDAQTASQAQLYHHIPALR